MNKTAFVMFLVITLILINGCTLSSGNVASTGAATSLDEQATAPPNQGIETQAQPEQQTTPPAVERQSYNQVVYNQDFGFTEFPTVKSLALDEKTKYDVYFEADKQIQFVVYAENRYDEWKQSGLHTLSKASTKRGPVCCSTGGTFNIDINIGEGGTYYFVFDDSKLPDKQNLPTRGKLIVTKLSNI